MRLALIARNFFLWAVPLGLFAVLSGSVSSALPYGSGTYGTCTYDTCSISVTTDGSVSLPVTPTSAGVNTTVKDEVTVSTGASTGYTLTFLDADTVTALNNGAELVPTSASTPLSPVILAMNTWGYRVDGLAGFGSGPTAAQSNDPTAQYTFAGVPSSNDTPHILAETTSAADPPVTTEVWYGVRMDGTKPSGTYTGVVTYTAVVNN